MQPERGSENIQRQVLPSVTVLTLDLDLIVDVEAGVSPRKEEVAVAYCQE